MLESLVYYKFNYILFKFLMLLNLPSIPSFFFEKKNIKINVILKKKINRFAEWFSNEFKLGQLDDVAKLLS